MTELVEIYEKNYDKMCKTISRRVGGIVNAEDVVQNTFVKALTYQRKEMGAKELEKWLNTILYNESFTFNRIENDHGVSRAWEEFDIAKTKLQETLSKKTWDFFNSGPNSEILNMYFKLGYTAKEISLLLLEDFYKVKNVVKKFKRGIKDVAA